MPSGRIFEFNRFDYAPQLFHLAVKEDKEAFDLLLQNNPNIQLIDQIRHLVKELIKLRNPDKRFSPDEVEAKATAFLNEQGGNAYGVWVYYSWLNRVVHLPGGDEFVEIRTNRNKYKITGEEQEALSKKTACIIGLSVGQSVALTIAMERVCGEIRLADFDTLDLSNLNRIRSGVHNLGLQKVVIAAREIAEIDPFIKVVCFPQGISEDNIETFLTGNGKADLLIDECDSLDVKILCRDHARRHGIPVLMDTSDRGMLDIERFDMEPERELFHGLVSDVDVSDLGKANEETRMKALKAIASFDHLSEKMKLSMGAIGKSISTWPQLASSVVLGGAVTTDIARRILLKQHDKSGRFYVDLEQLI